MIKSKNIRVLISLCVCNLCFCPPKVARKVLIDVILTNSFFNPVYGPLEESVYQYRLRINLPLLNCDGHTFFMYVSSFYRNSILLLELWNKVKEEAKAICYKNKSKLAREKYDNIAVQAEADLEKLMRHSQMSFDGRAGSSEAINLSEIFDKIQTNLKFIYSILPADRKIFIDATNIKLNSVPPYIIELGKMLNLLDTPIDYLPLKALILLYLQKYYSDPANFEHHEKVRELCNAYSANDPSIRAVWPDLTILFLLTQLFKEKFLT